MRHAYAGGGMAVLLFFFTGPLCRAALHGTVKDASGAAVPRARVYVLQPPFPARVAVTDATGAFQLAETRAGDCTLFASAPGLSGDKVQTPCDAGDAIDLT